MPGWHITLIDCGFFRGPHKIIITTPTRPPLPQPRARSAVRKGFEDRTPSLNDL
jgi:hypothetical protein